MQTTDTGFFGPESLTWKMHKELTVVLGGVRALLMHAAHPLVAAGARQVAGDRRDHPWARLMRTLSLHLAAPFGTREETRRTADRINALHAVVNGVDPVTGERYDARDPDLLLWVHACWEQSTVAFYELTVRPLTPWQKEHYHRECLMAAELVLLPPERVPPTYPALEAFIDEVVGSGRLLATDVAREVADLVRGGSVPVHLRPVWRSISFAAIGTLPPAVRDLYGFGWTPQRQRLLDAGLWTLKRVRPLLPARVRHIGPARIAERRLQGGQAEMPRS